MSVSSPGEEQQMNRYVYAIASAPGQVFKKGYLPDSDFCRMAEKTMHLKDIKLARDYL